ncbi:radical SAM/SPASM domain-containing protein, partial [Candidatus Margulisiibacteriota bacterium]
YSDLKKIVLEAKKCGINSIGLSGGEPFLYKNNMEMLKLLNDIKITQLKIATNGYFFNENIINTLCELKNLNIFFQISLDSENPDVNNFLRGENSYNTTIKLLNLINGKFKYTICTLVSKYNCGNIENTVNFLLNDLKADSVTISRAVNMGNAQKDNNETIDRGTFTNITNTLTKNYGKKVIAACLLNKKCFTPKMSLILFSDGYFYPCCYLIYKSQRLGSVKDGLENAINNIKTVIPKLEKIYEKKFNELICSNQYFSCYDCIECVKEYEKGNK